MMNTCPECFSKIYQYTDGEWLVWICWRCGHYESNTPAFQSCPEQFVNLVRERPFYFMKKYAGYNPSPKREHPNKTPEDGTEPILMKNFLLSSGSVINDCWNVF